MASDTPSAPFNSFPGAADTTDGRIYFSTPSAQVRAPYETSSFPPPHFCSHYTTRGKIIREWQRKGAAGVREAGGGKIIPRQRKNYPAAEYLSRAGAGGPKVRKKNLKLHQTVAQCRKHPIPYLYTLSQTIPYLDTLSRTIPYLNSLSRIVPYIKKLSRTIPYLNTLSWTQPILIH